MNYEEKYNNIVNTLQSLINDGKKQGHIIIRIEDIENAIPELAESEDERIRKELIEFVKSRGGFKQEYITWLEKLKVFAEHGDGLYYFRNNGFTYVDNPTCDNVSWLEKQGEKKSVDKVEPKFKVGDWVITKGNENVKQIVRIEYFANGQPQYILSNGLWFGNGTEARLWTIEDAKDGDVLVSQYNKPFIYNGNRDSFHIGSYCGISVEDKFKVATEKCHWAENVNIYPSTKEQRELLFQKIKEAGYEWDAEKKEIIL